MKILVSACLMGDNCKYSGGNNLDNEIVKYLSDKDYIKVCPECLGGLSTPRVPSEINSDLVLNKEGNDVTKYFVMGAQKTLEIAQKEKVACAIMKSKSPSCGCGLVYDGTFTNTLTQGNGITTKLLMANGIKIINSDTFMEE